MSNYLSNKNVNAMNESSNPMIHNTVLKLKYVIAMGALISITSCSSYTANLSDGGLEMPSYPVVQF